MPPSSTNNFFGIKVSKNGIPVNQASDKQLIYKDDFSTKTYYDQTNSRMIEGLLPDGSYGLWVSNPGVDVTTADPSVPGQLIFNSNQNILKLIAVGEYTKSTTTAEVVTIPHNLGFAPVYQAFVVTTATVVGGTGNLVVDLPYQISTLSSDAIMSMYVDDVNIYILIPSLDPSDVPFTVRYYLQQQSIPLTT